MLKIATKYPSSSTTALEKLAQELESRDDDAELDEALRAFRDSREISTMASAASSPSLPPFESRAGLVLESVVKGVASQVDVSWLGYNNAGPCNAEFQCDGSKGKV